MSMSVEMKDLIKSFEEWITFVGTLKDLDGGTWASSLEPGKWAIKDIISHMMLWDKYFYEEAINKIATNTELTLKHLNYDDFNREAMVYSKTITTDELMEKAIYYRKKIIETIEALPEEAVEQNYTDGDGNVFHIPQYLRDFIWHDQHHMNPLKDYLRK
ncbi:DinB family protein [Paenibacillus sanfengchensis]|uniref:DinB family protein n=1 Tax=Paenibacillus sanfengchensis TaxID=3119819 RepID=UPI002FE36E7E